MTRVNDTWINEETGKPADNVDKLRFGVCWTKPFGIAALGDVDMFLTEQRMRDAADEIERLRAALRPFAAIEPPAQNGFTLYTIENLSAARVALGEDR